MIVTRETLPEALDSLRAWAWLGIDLETTGLNPYQGDKIFSVAISKSLEEGYYFPAEFLPELRRLFEDPGKVWAAHNAKFDLGFLLAAGYEIFGPVYCTQTLARVEYNDHPAYSLDACAKRIGHEKDDTVKKYLEEHKLYEKIKIPGKKTIFKNYHFDQVPAPIIAPYAVKDAGLARTLLGKQWATFTHWEETRAHKKSVFPLVDLEQAFTKVIVEMESNGIRVDRPYCEQAAAHEASRIELAKRDFRALTGVDLTDSAKSLTEVFGRFGIDPGRTEKGNPSFTDGVLEKISHPVAHAIQAYRNASKRSGTYFSSFLYYSARNGRIHCSLNQGGTGTGRLSASSPNLQNLSDEDEAETDFPIRRAFLPDVGHKILSFDWKAMEYRMLFDLAGQDDLCDAIAAGLDPHQACADMMGVPRQAAKTINFLLLYGGGVDLLAERLGVPRTEAQRLKDLYFLRLPKVKLFINGVIQAAKSRGYIFNWMGRRYHFPDSNFAYKAPNYLIQGGCSDVLRVALVQIHKLLEGRETKLLVPIHDEIVFSHDVKELDLIPSIQEIMRTSYPYRRLPMDCSVYLGETLHDLKEIDGQTSRDPFKGKSLAGFTEDSGGMGRKDQSGLDPGHAGSFGLLGGDVLRH